MLVEFTRPIKQLDWVSGHFLTHMYIFLYIYIYVQGTNRASGVLKYMALQTIVITIMIPTLDSKPAAAAAATWAALGSYVAAVSFGMQERPYC